MIVGTEGSNATNFSKFDDCHLRVPASSQTANVSNLTPFRRASTVQEQMLRVLTTSISSSRRMPLRRTAASGFDVPGPPAEAGLAVVASASSAAASQAAARWRCRDGTASVAIVFTRLIDMAATNWRKKSGLGDLGGGVATLPHGRVS